MLHKFSVNGSKKELLLGKCHAMNQILLSYFHLKMVKVMESQD